MQSSLSIGINAYGGWSNQPIHEPSLCATMHATFEEYASSKTSTINHFYEKLLLLKDRLNTATALEIGNKRHAIMEQFLEEFFTEWNFKQKEPKDG